MKARYGKQGETPSVRDLAWEYLERVKQGDEKVSIFEYLAKLKTERQKDRFRELINTEALLTVILAALAKKKKKEGDEGSLSC